MGVQDLVGKFLKKEELPSSIKPDGQMPPPPGGGSPQSMNPAPPGSLMDQQGAGLTQYGQQLTQDPNLAGPMQALAPGSASGPINPFSGVSKQWQGDPKNMGMMAMPQRPGAQPSQGGGNPLFPPMPGPKQPHQEEIQELLKLMPHGQGIAAPGHITEERIIRMEEKIDIMYKKLDNLDGQLRNIWNFLQGWRRM